MAGIYCLNFLRPYWCHTVPVIMICASMTFIFESFREKPLLVTFLKVRQPGVIVQGDKSLCAIDCEKQNLKSANLIKVKLLGLFNWMHM